MTVIQHIPSFIEPEDGPFKIEVGTLADLLKYPFIESFQKSARFKRFSVSRESMPEVQGLLLAEFHIDHYPRWWVVAYLQGDISPVAELPEFKPF